ncbi:DUF4350 domain-containing protein [Hwanghaeella sp.]|uniref:DUF4350 domain-containing protein n=1 Tax=Hwanghaeella sp. TaxID=2605943 RepID=UPI003CCBF529
MKAGAVFDPRVIAVLICLGITGFVGSLIIGSLAGDPEVNRPVGANGFSTSAVGHRAFREMLEELGYEVRTYTRQGDPPADGMAALILAEPLTGKRAHLQRMVQDYPTLVVLPKWWVRTSFENPHWATEARLLSDNHVTAILQSVLEDATVQRVAAGPKQWKTAAIGAMPVIDGTVQLVSSDKLFPLVSTDEGVLVGAVADSRQTTIIVADPDILATHGLGKGANAALMVKLLDSFGGDGAIVFDETIHGFRTYPGVTTAIFDMPFVWVTALVGLTIAVLVWASIGRFGAPFAERETVNTGGATLVESTSDLVVDAGNLSESFKRYAAQVQARAARRLHAPKALSRDELVDWLDKVGRNRGARHGYRELMRQVLLQEQASGKTNGNLLRLARALRRWEEEVTHGDRSRPRNGG